MSSPETGPNLGAIVPSPEAHELLMASAEARQQRRAIKLGRLSVHPGIVKRGRVRQETPEEGMMPIFDSLTPQEFNQLQMAYYRGTEPLFDQFTRGYHVEPKKRSIDAYVSGSKDEAKENAQKLRDLRGDSHAYAIERNKMQRQTQHRSDSLCHETSVNAYTAKLRRASLHTTLELIKRGQDFDERAAVFAADAIHDFGFGITANQELLRLGKNFGYKISYIGEKAFDDHALLRQNTDLMEVVLREQDRRLNYWGELARTSLLYLGQNRLTTADREAQAEVDWEIDRQAAIRDNIVSDES